MRATFSFHLIFPALNIITILGEEYEVYGSLLCNFCSRYFKNILYDSLNKFK